MDHITDRDLFNLIDRATSGDKDALETVILSVQDLVFNLSLRMLGSFPDAEDASQDIILKIITHLSSFQKESSFSTWVFRIASNHLINCKKHRFANMPLSFEYYGDDIEHGAIHDLPDLTQSVDKSLLEEELKLSCTNVMLQCLDPESRCIFVLGTMFQVDSRIAGDSLGMTAEAYRQRLSRIRRKVAGFLTDHCGEFGAGRCKCRDRINYAIQSHRLDPARLDYASADKLPEEKILQFKAAMEHIDDLSAQFSFCRAYATPERIKQFLHTFLNSATLSTVKET